MSNDGRTRPPVKIDTPRRSRGATARFLSLFIEGISATASLDSSSPLYEEGWRVSAGVCQPLTESKRLQIYLTNSSLCHEMAFESFSKRPCPLYLGKLTSRNDLTQFD